MYLEEAFVFVSVDFLGNNSSETFVRLLDYKANVPYGCVAPWDTCYGKTIIIHYLCTDYIMQYYLFDSLVSYEL